MPHLVDIDATATGLNQYVNKYSPKIHAILRQGLEFERILSFVQAYKAYTGTDVSVGDALQPYQYQFTPNNQENFTAITAHLVPIKIDLLFTAEQMEKFWDKWAANWFDPDPSKIQMKYTAFILSQVILPKAMEDLNLASWAGAYAAPAGGTPGTVLESVDGFRKKIADHIASGKFVPINTGALVAATMVSQVRDFCKAIPEPYRYRQGVIFMSKTRAQQYHDAYVAEYKINPSVIKDPNKLMLRVDNFNKTIVGITAMEGSDRMIVQFTGLDGMQIGTRKGYPKYFNFRFEKFERTLKVMAEIYRFYDFETPLHTFLNEQV